MPKSKKAAVMPPEVLEAAWKPNAPEGDAWTPRPWVAPSVRMAEGRKKRKQVKRTSHAALDLRPGRDPIAILAAQEADRLQDLVPLRHQRMAENAFAYYRGTPAVMAWDLAESPRTDIYVQASTRTWATSGCSHPPSGRSCSTPTTSTRRCRHPGSGTSSASR